MQSGDRVQIAPTCFTFRVLENTSTETCVWTMNIEETRREFYSEVRSQKCPFVVNDLVRIVAGPTKGTIGSAVSVELEGDEMCVFVEFGDGSSGIFIASDLEVVISKATPNSIA